MVTALYILMSDDDSHNITGENDNEPGAMNVKPDSHNPAAEPVQHARPPPPTLPTTSTSPPMAPPQVLMVRYTEVIDHPSFQDKHLFVFFADCTHHKMTNSLQARLPFRTARNRVRQYVHRFGLGIHYNPDSNPHRDHAPASQKDFANDAHRLRQRQHRLRARQSAERPAARLDHAAQIILLQFSLPAKQVFR